MRCPKCGFSSFDYYDACPKCNKDWGPTKQLLGIQAYEPGDRQWLASLVSDMDEPEPEPMADDFSMDDDAETAMLNDYGDEEIDTEGEEISLSGAEEIQLSIGDEDEETILVDEAPEDEEISFSPDDMTVEEELDTMSDDDLGLDLEDDTGGLELNLDDSSDEDEGLDLPMDEVEAVDEVADLDLSEVEMDPLGEETMQFATDDLDAEDADDLVFDEDLDGALGNEDTVELEADDDLILSEEPAGGGFDPDSTMVIEPEMDTLLAGDEEDDFDMIEDETLADDSGELSLDLDDLELNLDD